MNASAKGRTSVAKQRSSGLILSTAAHSVMNEAEAEEPRLLPYTLLRLRLAAQPALIGFTDTSLDTSFLHRGALHASLISNSIPVVSQDVYKFSMRMEMFEKDIPFSDSTICN